MATLLAGCPESNDEEDEGISLENDEEHEGSSLENVEGKERMGNLSSLSLHNRSHFYDRDNTALVQSFLNHGYAFVCLDEVLVSNLKESCIFSFFNTLTRVEKMKFQRFILEVNQNKGLVGYNKPSVCKEVYRVRRGSSNKDMDTWPSEAFYVTVLGILNSLEEIAGACIAALKDEVIRQLGLSFVEKHCRTWATPTKQSSLPQHVHSNSPMDFFHYFNNSASAEVQNCSVHVDPGILTVIPCASTPGLCVFDQASQSWVEVEKGLMVAGDCSHGHPSRDTVVVLLGDTLQRISNGIFRGTVHTVVHAHRPRLSCCYEMRPQVTTASGLSLVASSSYAISTSCKPAAAAPAEDASDKARKGIPSDGSLKESLGVGSVLLDTQSIAPVQQEEVRVHYSDCTDCSPPQKKKHRSVA